jgi:predicted ATPase
VHVITPYFMTLVASACRKVGRIDEGLRALDNAQRSIDARGERWWEAEVRRLRGELLLCQLDANADEAEKCFRQALDISRSQQAKSLELRAVMSLARLWQRQGKQNEAHGLLGDCYAWFTEGFDTADLREAKELLETMS